MKENNVTKPIFVIYLFTRRKLSLAPSTWGLMSGLCRTLTILNHHGLHLLAHVPETWVYIFACTTPMAISQSKKELAPSRQRLMLPLIADSGEPAIVSKQSHDSLPWPTRRSNPP
ncbi:hypothetical protein EVAR_19806_1 [Eumeta japonica]|uniref:Uncharacterized protein n=1 Tax=Eumeta variegata TaxID=151549 RepID=A0A4C1USI0_EUMVA|nr:hypothetical protein EVAR_19806_1 [Eumeta japonica]